jgi:hypothetical protein
MSAMLLLRWVVPVFALAVAATVFVIAGPMAAGLTFVAFLLGVVTSELHHMRWSPVEAPSHAAADSAFLALLDTEAGRAAPPAAAPEPPPAPKRNFQPVVREMAIGSGEIRLPLVERRGLHARASQSRTAVRTVAPMLLEPARPELAEPELAAVVEPEPRSFTLRASFGERVPG